MLISCAGKLESSGMLVTVPEHQNLKLLLNCVAKLRALGLSVARKGLEDRNLGLLFSDVLLHRCVAAGWQ